MALLEGLEPATTYTAVVHEEVFSSVIGLDKAVALLVIELLDRSLGHVPEPAFLSLEYPPFYYSGNTSMVGP